MVRSRLQVPIRSLMVTIGVIAPFLALARVDLYLAMMSILYAIPVGMLAWMGGRKSLPCVLVCIASQAALIASWPLIRDGALLMVLRVGRPDIYEKMGPFRYDDVGGYSWRRLWSWEAWSLWRWWVVFGALAWRLSGRRVDGDDRSAWARSLLKFTPWLAVLELGYLAGAWLAFGSPVVVPEPSTIFAAPWPPTGWLKVEPWTFWLIRGAIPTFIVGIAFFRVIGRWRWAASALGAVALMPLTAFVSMLASLGYLFFRDIDLIP